MEDGGEEKSNGMVSSHLDREAGFPTDRHLFSLSSLTCRQRKVRRVHRRRGTRRWSLTMASSSSVPRRSQCAHNAKRPAASAYHLPD